MWREITEDDVLTTLTAPETSAFRRAATQAGQDDPLEAVITTSVQEARGYVAGCKSNELAAGCTVPSAMIHHVLAIVRYRFISRLPISVSDAREQEYKDARAYLRDVSRCMIGIEQPETGEASDASYPAARPTINSRRSSFKRNQQDGI